jgi:hypothetical protein
VRVATRLAGFRLPDWTGEPRELAAAWRDRTAVLVFIRHFG